MKKELSLALSILCLSLLSYNSHAQDASSKKINYGVEIQAYPTGIIPGLHFSYPLAEKSEIELRLGYQYIRHGDLGVHEDERGNGYGFTLGYVRYFSSNYSGFNLGFRNDIWFNDLDWSDNIDTPIELNGNSKITVVQPTIIAGYALRSKSFTITPTLAFGFEVNAKTDGEDVGEGAILLIGCKVKF